MAAVEESRWFCFVFVSNAFNCSIFLHKAYLSCLAFAFSCQRSWRWRWFSELWGVLIAFFNIFILFQSPVLFHVCFFECNLGPLELVKIVPLVS